MTLTGSPSLCTYKDVSDECTEDCTDTDSAEEYKEYWATSATAGPGATHYLSPLGCSPQSDVGPPGLMEQVYVSYNFLIAFLVH